MKKFFGQANVGLRKNELAKILSLVMGTTSLVAPMVFATGCSFWDEDDCECSSETSTTDDKNTDTENSETKLTLDDNGIGTWSEFVQKAMKETTDVTTGVTSYSLETVLDNVADIKGFRGRANYEQVKALIASADYNKKRYNTAGLAIYFDYVAKDGAGVEVVPSMLDTIYRYFDTVNITNVNDYGEKTPVKFSSGDATSPEIIDLEQFYSRLQTRKLTVPSDVIVTQNTTSVNLLGVADPYLRTERVSDSARLVALLQSPLFKNAKLDVLTLNGDVKPVMSLFDRENVNGNVSFTSDAYYQGAGQDVENISMYGISRFVNRGAKANVRDVNVVPDNNTTATVNFSNANMSNVSFASSLDLSTLATGFDYVTAKGTLTFNGKLPTSMTYLNAENVVMDGAIVPTDGTDVTGDVIKFLRAKDISNVAGFKQTETTPIGSVGKYDGLRTYYEKLKTVFNISTDGIRFELLTMLKNLNRQSVYS